MLPLHVVQQQLIHIIIQLAAFNEAHRVAITTRM
jgi:hypothetical protein